MRPSPSPSAPPSLDHLLPDLYRLRDIAELPRVMLELVSTVIPNVFATCNRMDLRSGTVTAAYYPEEWQPRMEAIMPQMHPHVHTHPIYRHVFDTGDGSARFVADFVEEDEWRQGPFARALAPLGVEECLIFCLQTSRQELVFIALNRAARTFTEAERAIANALRPHFIAAYENAIVFTESQALAALTAHAISSPPNGFVLDDGAGHVLYMSVAASELLDRFFPRSVTWKTELPPPVRHWLAQQNAGPLQIEHSGATLTVRAASSGPASRVIYLKQAAAGPASSDHLRTFGLTPRETEVLHWLTEGKSNPEIGTILAISSRTVAKHLQAIFEKLGVEGRIPAILRAREF